MKTTTTLLILLLALAACAANGGDEPTLAATQSPADRSGALQTIAPAANEQETPMLEREEPAQSEASAPVAPAQVDLSQITPKSVESSEPHVMPAPGVPNMPVPESLQKIVADITADLSQRLSLDESDIRTVNLEEVVWRDGSIGCPQPGMMYTQALVGGHRITLEAQGKTYFYHTQGTNRFVYCENADGTEQ